MSRKYSAFFFTPFVEADIAVSVRIEAYAEERDLTCDNTSRPGFRIDPPFAWETAHEAYFGAVASAQDLLEVTPVSTPIWWKQGQICLMADPANGRWGR